jgi:phage portal protein BeeE
MALFQEQMSIFTPVSASWLSPWPAFRFMSVKYRGQGKERVRGYPLYALLHDDHNPEVTTVTFRERAMILLLLWGNAYAQIFGDGTGRVVGLYQLLQNHMSVERDEHGVMVYISLLKA